MFVPFYSCGWTLNFIYISLISFIFYPICSLKFISHGPILLECDVILSSSWCTGLRKAISYLTLLECYIGIVEIDFCKFIFSESRSELKQFFLLPFLFSFGFPLQWCHNEHDGVSNHWRLDGLLNRLVRRKSRKTSKLRVTGPLWGEFTSHRLFSFDDVIMHKKNHKLKHVLISWLNCYYTALTKFATSSLRLLIKLKAGL